MKKRKYILFVIFSILFSNKLTFAEIYKWVDDKGTTHFSDTPPINNFSSTSTIKTDLYEDSNHFNLNYYGYPKKRVDTLKIVRLLKDNRFKKLDDLFLEYYNEFKLNFRYEKVLITALRSFYRPEISLEDHLTLWVKKTPTSDFSLLSRATYYIGMAYRARGYKSSNRTTSTQYRDMKKYLNKAISDLNEVLISDNKQFFAYYLLLQTARSEGRIEKSKEYVVKALKISPYSFYARAMYMINLTPRWGGSYEEMQKIINECKKYFSVNPRLKLLQGYIPWDQGDLMMIYADTRSNAMDKFNQALSYGDSSLFYFARGKLYYELNKFEEALLDFNKSISLEPSYTDLIYRAKIHFFLAKDAQKKNRIALIQTS